MSAVDVFDDSDPNTAIPMEEVLVVWDLWHIILSRLTPNPFLYK